jgi:hypothetical protein
MAARRFCPGRSRRRTDLRTAFPLLNQFFDAPNFAGKIWLMRGSAAFCPSYLESSRLLVGEIGHFSRCAKKRRLEFT